MRHTVTHFLCFVLFCFVNFLFVCVDFFFYFEKGGCKGGGQIGGNGEMNGTGLYDVEHNEQIRFKRKISYDHGIILNDL